MKTFYRNSTLFFGLMLLVFVSMETLLRRIPNEYKFKYNTLCDSQKKFTTMIFGNSFTYFGINPIFITTPTFNTSQIDESIYLHYYKYKKAIQYHKEIKTIIVPISSSNLQYSKYPDAKLNLFKNYLIYCNVREPVSIFKYSEITSDDFKIQINRMISYYIKKEQSIFCNQFGWGDFYRTSNKKDLYKTTKIRHATIQNRIKNGEKENAIQHNKALLYEWANDCAKRNIKMIVLNMPISSVMKQKFDRNCINQFNTFMEKFKTKNKHCSFYNWQDLPHFDDSEFYDADHLNGIGAKKMSLWIDSLINK